jgi:hypothetical protein
MSGVCEECSKKKRFGLQTKLKVNKPGDNYEQEADRVADQVLVTSAHHAVSDAPPRIQRFSGQPNGHVDAVPASVDQALASPGRPLEPTLRQDMEQRFGHDFSRVRVHSGAAAEQSVQDINAHAYTIGRNIVFGAGQFAPGTHEGRRLLAHELTHIVQQTGHGVTAIQRKEKQTDGSWLALAAAAERLSKASLRLYQVEPGERALLEIIEPESPISAPLTQQAVKTKVAHPMGGRPEKIESPFTDYIDLQETLRTFETSLVSHLREGASVVLDTTETRLKRMYAKYVGKGPHLDWLQNLSEGHPQHGFGWLERRIEELKQDPDVIKLWTDHEEFKRAMNREQAEDDPRNINDFARRQLERKRKLDKAQQQYNDSLRQVLRKKSELFFLPGFDVGSFLHEKSGQLAQNKLIGFLEGSGSKVQKARKKLGDRRFLYGADILLESIKERLAERLAQDPEFNRSVIGEDPVLGPLAQEAKLSQRVETLNFIVDGLARERKSESTLWEDIVKVLGVLSTFVPGPIGWGIRGAVAAAKFDISISRAADQATLFGVGASAVYDPNAGSRALAEAFVEVATDSPFSSVAKGAKRLTLGLGEDLAGKTARQGQRAATDVGTSAVREGEDIITRGTDDLVRQQQLKNPAGGSNVPPRRGEVPAGPSASPEKDIRGDVIGENRDFRRIGGEPKPRELYAELLYSEQVLARERELAVKQEKTFGSEAGDLEEKLEAASQMPASARKDVEVKRLEDRLLEVEKKEKEARERISAIDRDLAEISGKQKELAKQGVSGYRKRTSAELVPARQLDRPPGAWAESTGADVVRGERMEGRRVLAAVEDEKAMRTHIDAGAAEDFAYKDALARGEIGIQRPGRINEGGADFITARRNSSGEIEIVLHDATIDVNKKLDRSQLSWVQEATDAIEIKKGGATRLQLHNPTLESEIREALAKRRFVVEKTLVEVRPNGVLFTPLD